MEHNKAENVEAIKQKESTSGYSVSTHMFVSDEDPL